MVGSGKKLYRAESVCVFLERGQTVPTQPARRLPSGVWGAAPAEIEFGVF